jgi:hypothetical protein
LHRLWRWPQRSSHDQDQLGYRPCTLTRRPAPKSTATFYVSFLFLRKSRGKVLKKNCSTGIFSASLGGLVPWASLWGNRAARLVDRFSAGRMAAGLTATMAVLHSLTPRRAVATPKDRICRVPARRCSHGGVSPCCWEQTVLGATAPKRLGAARRLQASLFGRHPTRSPATDSGADAALDEHAAWPLELKLVLL